MIPATFTKEERLKSRKAISKLFKEGDAFNMYPIRWVFLKNTTEEKFPVRVAFSVSKRRFKLAVDRNRAKRRMREAWRLNKHLIYEQIPEGESYSIMLIFISKEMVPYRTIDRKLKSGIRRFIQRTN